MKKSLISTFLSTLLFLGAVVCAVIYNVNKPRLMILHSYHTDYSWTRNIDRGMMRVLENRSDITIVRHYMDTKKRKDKQWLQKTGILARQAIDKWKPDVLIAVDNLAQKLAAKFYVDHPEISIVFAGINGSIEPYGYHRANNVTGILENRPCHALRDLILSIKNADSGDAAGTVSKNDIRLLYMIDASLSVQADKQYIEQFNWTPLHYTGAFVAKTFEQWKEKILSLDQSIDYVFVTNYRQLAWSDQNKSFISPNKVMEWTQANSKVPVVGLNPFNVRDGCMLSVGVSPYEQGETVASMALQILEKNKNPGDLPVVESKQFVISMRKSAITKKKLILPDIYEAFSRATNTFHE